MSDFFNKMFYVPIFITTLKFSLQGIQGFYSDLKLLTGLATAAFIA